MDVQRERAKGLPRKLRRFELERVDRTEERTEQILDRMEAELRRMPPVDHAARRELAAAEQVLAKRLQAALLAARLSPPTYITKELGERPLDRAMASAWDRGVMEIEGYRQRMASRTRAGRSGESRSERCSGPRCVGFAKRSACSAWER